MHWATVSFKSIIIAIFMALISISLMPKQVKPSELEVAKQQQERNFRAKFILAQSSATPDQSTPHATPPPPDQGAPRGTKPGAGRNPCPNIPKALTPLVLVDQQIEDRELRWGYTTQDYPTFWAYVPYEAQAIRSGKFSLRNKDGEIVYETDLTITGTAGIISMSVPSTAPPLESGKWYRWYLFLDVYCTSTTPAQPDSIDGWVKRMEPNAVLKTQLENATPQQRAILYTKEGFLYDALSTLAVQMNSNSIKDDWRRLLSDSGLESIANEPVVNCCNSNGQ